MPIWPKHKPALPPDGVDVDTVAALRPLDGAATLFVRSDATMATDAPSVAGARLVWSVYTDGAWRQVRDLDPTHETLGMGLSITAVAIGGGEVRFAAGAGVAGGAPVGVVEVTNASSTPLAVGIDVESPELSRRVERAVWIGSHPVITSWSPTRSTPQVQDDGVEPQLIVPVPHQVTARFSVALDDGAPWISTGASPVVAVPTLEDIERGWELHLARGMRFVVSGDQRWGDGANRYLHAILTSSSAEIDLDDVTAASLYGFGLPVGHVLAAVQRGDARPAETLIALGTWNRLNEPSTIASDDVIEHLIVAVAKAAHRIDRSDEIAPVPLGCGSRPLGQLSRSMDILGQPDIAERLTGLGARFDHAATTVPSPPSLSTLDGWQASFAARDARDAAKQTRSQYLIGLRERLVDSHSDGAVTLLADLAPAWRGRGIEVFNAPVGDATVSYGLRWHGPRPALLWSVEPLHAEDARLAIQVPSIDPDWITRESSGEVLLADPGWVVS